MDSDSQDKLARSMDAKGEPHSALMIDVILKTVFRHLEKAEDVYACKQVCQKWNDVIDSIKQDILYPKVLASVVVANAVGLSFAEQRETALKMRQVSRQWKRDTDLGIANFSKLKYEWNGTSDLLFFMEILGFNPISLGSENINRFLKEMELWNGNPFVGRQLVVTWSEPSMKSSLMRLLDKVGGYVFNFTIRGKNFRTFPDYLLIREILAKLPNLQMLSLQCECPPCCAQEFNKMQWNDEMFQRLVEQHPLKKLPNLRSYFGFFDWGVDARLIKTIIQTHKLQLNEVTSRNWNFPLHVPAFDLKTEFPKLLELHQAAEGFSHLSASVNVLRPCNLPLRELRITLKDLSQLADLKNLGSNLKRLAICFLGGTKARGKRNQKVDKRLGENFPRLQSLSLFFEKGSYKGSFKRYKKQFTTDFINAFPSLCKLELWDEDSGLGLGAGCYKIIRLK
ncbi:unnamed protein product [Orchesella dallaii]|uniref:F-box domain-containing protein n=1 Tax=Orchesella dallaii TaxID=48710 RepID=A0ABP1QRZ5_9HEXA